MSLINYPLNNAQIELLKLFSTDLSDKELIEFRDLLSRFYADKAVQEADSLWDKRGLSDADMKRWLNNK